MAARCPCWSRLQSSFSIRIVCQIWPHTFLNWKKWRFFFGSWTGNRGGRRNIHVSVKPKSSVITWQTKPKYHSIEGHATPCKAYSWLTPMQLPPYILYVFWGNETLPFLSYSDKLDECYASPFYCFFSPNMQKLPLLFAHESHHRTQATLSRLRSCHIHARESPYGCSQRFLDEDARQPEPRR